MKSRPYLLAGLAGLLFGGYGGWKIGQVRAETVPPETSRSTAPTSSALSLQEVFSAVAENVGPAVVSIRATEIREVPFQYFWSPFEEFEEFFEEWFGQPRRPRRRPPMRRERVEGFGSGVVIHEKGYVLTNHHVVRDAEEVTVTFYSGDKSEDYPAKVIGRDPLLDLAVVRLKRMPKKLPVARMGDSDKIRVGDWVIAIGSPFGLAQTVTAGIVSAKRQRLEIEGRIYENLIQTDAAINRGNSGGPLVNLAGEVVGINTAIYTPSGGFAGVGFAIPIRRAQEILEDLIEKGRVVRGWLGVTIKPVDEAVAKQFGLPRPAGALVQDLQRGGPAEKAGLKPGDVIVAVEGNPVEDVETLQRYVRRSDPKKSVRMEIYRDGKRRTIYVRLGEMPENPEEAFARAGPSEEAPQEEKEGARSGGGLGVRVRFPQPAEREAAGLSPSESGVIVVEVDPDSAGARLGLQPGDIVVRLNRQPTPDPESFEKAAGRAKLSEGVVVEILRNGVRLFLSRTER